MTIHDVARRSGVSIATVSLALNEKGTLSDRTRAHVREVADELGYMSNAIARAMRGAPIGVFGLILRPLDELGFYRLRGVDYFTRLTGALAIECLERRRSLLTLPDPSRGPRSPVVSALDGYFVADPIIDDPVLRILDQWSVPYVTIGDPVGPQDSADEDCPDAQDTRRVLEHLRLRGARRIALVAGTDPNTWNSVSVAEYRRFASACGMPPLVRRVPERDGEEGGERTARDLIDEIPMIDAAYLLTGRHASGFQHEVQRRGLHVPDDIQIIAGSDSAQCRTAQPPITAVDLHPEAHASQVVDELILKIENPRDTRHAPAARTSVSRLLLRSSTRAAQDTDEAWSTES
ncbi:LacI family DNA-binding transcriptional regulator [Micrococcus sp. IITD107]|uniref:LacI family DNA-binding transcriptional regulator n=1 Tax=Micrococcus sp. IITD107 TaxID=3342790 RepID=UPI0035BA4EFC